MKPRLSVRLPVLTCLFSLVLAACAATTRPDQNTGGPLAVVATTTLVGDVVRHIAGEQIELTVLIPPGVDEHGYEPTPRDVAKVAEADLVFRNGAGLESFMEPLMESAGGNARHISLSDSIELQQDPVTAEEQGKDAHTEGDPHVWTDPNNVLIWVDRIEQSLVEADAENAAIYQANADQYRQQLRELDSWIVEQVSRVPEDQRKLVTDHTVFTYFASRYGFEQVGAVVPGYNSLSEPSAQEVAALEDTIRALELPVIFVGNTVNPALAERIAQDTGTELVEILTGSLTGPDGPAPTYLEYMRFNVTKIVEALE